MLKKQQKKGSKTQDKRTLLEEHTGSKTTINLPKVNRAHATFVVLIAVRAEEEIGLFFELTKVVRRQNGVIAIYRRIVLVGPGRTIRISITIVVALDKVPIATAGYIRRSAGETG